MTHPTTTKKELKQDLLNIRNGAMITPILEKLVGLIGEAEERVSNNHPPSDMTHPTTISSIIEKFRKQFPVYDSCDLPDEGKCECGLESFIREELTAFLDEIKKEIEKTKLSVSAQMGTHKHDSCYEDTLRIIKTKTK